MASIGGDDIYEVEKIIKKRCHPSKGEQYFVKWRNFPASENTWEPSCNFSPTLIDQFERKRKRKSTKARTKQQLAVFNPIGSHTLPVIDKLVYEPQLPEQPITVTDVTSKDETVTICECEQAEGFFKTSNKN